MPSDLLFCDQCICFVIKVGCFELFSRRSRSGSKSPNVRLCFVHIIFGACYIYKTYIINVFITLNKYMSSCKQDHYIRLIVLFIGLMDGPRLRQCSCTVVFYVSVKVLNLCKSSFIYFIRLTSTDHIRLCTWTIYAMYL